MGIESREKQHYNTHAEHVARRATMPASQIVRWYALPRIVRPVVEARGGLGTMVDVGCGVGMAAVILKGRYERYIGVDLSPGVIEVARRIAADVQSAEFIAANIKDAPLPDAIADVVFCNGSLHHMTDLPGVMATLKRIAKPGAWFVAREPQRGNPLFGALRAIRKVADPSYSSDQRYFSRQEIIDLARDAGLTQVEVCSQGLLTPPLALVMWRLQVLAVPVARIAVKLEDSLERIMRGPLARMSWNIMVYGRFP